MNQLGVIVYGCGVMGQGVLKALQKKKTISLLGAVDINPDLVGKDAGTLLDDGENLGIQVTDQAEALFDRVNAQAVVLTTTSHLKTVYPQLEQCIKAGLNVISTCEELSFPWKRHPELARKIDTLAREKGVTIVGTGINPGYLMDTLPLMLTASCLRVDYIEVNRMMNSARRRIPFQKKVGTSMTPEEFNQKIRDKIITGHVGLLESINMIAAGLGWEIEEAVELPPEPVIPQQMVESGLGTVPPGNVIGLSSVAYATREGKKAIVLKFVANAGVEEEYDEIIIRGNPSVHQRILGGVHGDTGTIAVTVNSIPRAVEAPAGIVTMKDLPPVITTL